jgi:GH25 family lysozyme M1 (1,4-beta-N-acetylmuramidase)
MSEAVSYNKSLRRGRHQLKQLQKFLNTEEGGSAGLKVDGAMGNATTKALAAFQDARLDLVCELVPAGETFTEAGGKYGPHTQYAIGRLDPNTLDDDEDPSSKYPNPQRMEKIKEFARANDLIIALDLYHHNPEPDYAAIKAWGVEAIILKGSQSSTGTQKDLLERAQRVVDAGLVLGDYHFASPSNKSGDPEREARHAVAIAKTMPSPVVLFLDIESDPDMTPKELHRWIRAFFTVADGLIDGVPVEGYSYSSYIRRSLDGFKGAEDIGERFTWIARYPGDPTLENQPERPWKIWQVTSRGCHPSSTKRNVLKRIDVCLVKRSWWESHVGTALPASCPTESERLIASLRHGFDVASEHLGELSVDLASAFSIAEKAGLDYLDSRGE